MKRQFYIDPSLKLKTSFSMLESRLHRLRSKKQIKHKTAKIDTGQEKSALPKLRAKSQFILKSNHFYEPHPKPADKDKYLFYLPSYKVMTKLQNGVNIPQLNIKWLTGSSAITEDTVVAELIVNFEKINPPLPPTPLRIVPHNLSLSLVYFAIENDGKNRHRVELPFERVSQLSNGRFIAQMDITGKRGVARIVNILSSNDFQTSFSLTATADVYISKFNYAIDLPSLNKPKFYSELLKKELILQAVMPTPLVAVRPSPPARPTPPTAVRPSPPVMPTFPRVVRPNPVGPFRPTFRLGMTMAAALRPAITVAPSARIANPQLFAMAAVFRAPKKAAFDTTVRSAVIAKHSMSKVEVAERFTRTDRKVGSKKAISLLAIKNRSGKPLIIKEEISTSKKFPAFYAIENFGQIYSEIPTNILNEIRQLENPAVLVAFNVMVGSELRIVYQDPMQTNHFFYLPEKYKLGRADNPPFEPLMRIGFQELLLEENQPEQVGLDYQVQVSFTCLPELDQVFLSAARSDTNLITAANGKEIVLSPLDADAVSFELDDSAGGELIEEDISLTLGVMATVEFDANSFSSFFTRLITDEGVAAIKGQLRIPMLGDTQKSIEVSVSLYDMTGAIFSQQWSPEDQPGNYRMSLTNETESVVDVSSTRAWVVAEEKPTRVAITNSLSQFSVQPGESQDLQLQVTPPSAAILDLTVATQHRFTLDVDALWRLLTINQGLSTYAFTITVSMDRPELFGVSPGDGIPPLSAIKVEFQEGSEIELTAEQLEVEIVLYKSLLSDLQQKPLTETYTYRVINIHGNEEWARGNWVNQLGGSLFISPVMPGA